MSFGVTADGFVLKRLEDIKAEMQDDARSIFGIGINLDERSPMGQLIGVAAERHSKIWELAQDIYNSQDVMSVEDAAQDLLYEINDVQRLAPTKSTTNLYFLATLTGITIPIGTVVSRSDNPDIKFVTTEEKVTENPVTPFALVPAEAQTTGPIQAPAGTLTVLESVISGVLSVMNLEDAVLGTDLETNEAYRLRRAERLHRRGSATLEGIMKSVETVPGVSEVGIEENASPTVDDFGRPPHSFETIVTGGSDALIGAAILAAKPAGIQAYGDESVDVLDNENNSHSIGFSRVTPRPIYLIVDIVPNTTPSEGAVYPTDGDQKVVQAILDYGANFRNGQDVVLNLFFTPINEVPGVRGITIKAGIAADPTESDNIAIPAKEKATFLDARITVNS